MKHLGLFVVAALLAFAPPVAAEEVDDPKAWIEGFASALVEAGPETAFDMLRSSWIGQQRPDDIQQVLAPMREPFNAAGPARGWEHAGELVISQSFVRYRIIVLHEARPAGWSFTFYRPATPGWRLLRFKLEESAGDLESWGD